MSDELESIRERTRIRRRDISAAIATGGRYSGDPFTEVRDAETLLAVLGVERERVKLVRDSLIETRDAAAALMHGIDDTGEYDIVEYVPVEIRGFGARANAAIEATAPIRDGDSDAALPT